MPSFLPTLTNLKDLTNTINPLNLFSSPDTSPTSPTSRLARHDEEESESGSESESDGEDTGDGGAGRPGPGPSSQAHAQGRNRMPNLSPAKEAPARPLRPSLKDNPSGSSSGSGSSSSVVGAPNGEPRRKGSGNSVIISAPSPGSQLERPSKWKGDRPVSAGSGMTGMTGVSADERRRRKPMDTYIIVKPPPTASKNPLNLQIQLVVRPARGPARDRSGSRVTLTSIATPTASIASVSMSATNTPSRISLDSPMERPPFAPVDMERSRSDSPAPLSSSDEAAPLGLTRQVSRKSSLSHRSSSAQSTGTASTISGGAGKRIEPMFNLQVHNVMQPTIVTDASTDVKVAKFLKRQVDISGVGILEPSEIWVPLPNSSQSIYPAMSHTVSRLEDPGPPIGGKGARPVSMVSLSAPISPTTSRADNSSIRNSLEVLRPENLLGVNGDSGRTKQFFGKMFKRKGSQDIGTGKPRKSPAPSFSSTLASGSVSVPGPAPSTSSAGKAAGAPTANGGESASQHVGQPTFGTAPMVVTRRGSGTLVSPDGAVTGLTAGIVGLGISSSSTLNVTPTEKGETMSVVPSNRPVGYTWTVRKFSKKSAEGWAAHLVAAAAAGLDLVGNAFMGEGQDEVVFEWVKLRVPPSTAAAIRRRLSVTGTAPTLVRPPPIRSSSRPASLLAPEPASLDSPTTSKTSLTLAPPKPSNASPKPPSSPTIPPSASAAQLPPPPPLADPRPVAVRRVSASASPVSRRSPTPDLEGRDETASIAQTIDEGEESDPEDSETPWVCSVWVKKTGQRQMLGTLTPAPHHPKVIGVLKIPTKLDPVCLAQIHDGPAEPKVLSGMPNPIFHSNRQEALAKRVKSEVAMTEENLKDVVCVTAMWLVAREEFGGLGRGKKK